MNDDSLPVDYPPPSDATNPCHYCGRLTKHNGSLYSDPNDSNVLIASPTVCLRHHCQEAFSSDVFRKPAEDVMKMTG